MPASYRAPALRERSARGPDDVTHEILKLVGWQSVERFHQPARELTRDLARVLAIGEHVAARSAGCTRRRFVAITSRDRK